MSEEIPPSPREERTRRLADAMRRQLGRFGALLAEPDVLELMLNADGVVWVERLGEPMRPVGAMPETTAESFIATVASTQRSAVTRESPIIECELPRVPPFDGARFEALIPPVVSAPVFAIRRKASRVFSLDEYVLSGVMTKGQCRVIRDAVADRKNILVAGGTGSGKTTLTNAILQAIVEASPDHRLVIIEDTAELQCPAENAVTLRATETIAMPRLLRATLRLRPDRIIVGEVRGAEALTLLKAWNTGHPGGVCTIHANGALAALTRTEQLVAEISETPMRHLIAEAIDLVVSIRKTNGRPGRRIDEVAVVTGVHDDRYKLITPEVLDDAA